MNTKLAVALALTVGFVGGGIVSKYLSPISALAQSKVPTLVSPLRPIELTTLRGTKLGEFDPSRGVIRLSPIVELRVSKTAEAVSIEFSK